MKREELKAIVMESVLDSLNEQELQGQTEKQEYALGQRYAVRDKKTGKTTDISGYSKWFQQGYKSVMGNTMWNKINNGLTNFIARMGYSRTRGL